jgi:hypothetical protein
VLYVFYHFDLVSLYLSTLYLRLIFSYRSRTGPGFVILRASLLAAKSHSRSHLAIGILVFPLG